MLYVEKPVSNAIEPALKMVAAVRNSKQVVQVGCQQRDWTHFQEWHKKTLDGYIGKINHCVLLYPGAAPSPPRSRSRRSRRRRRPLSTGRCSRDRRRATRTYRASRLRWRSYWDYGGGAITDGGVHLTDVMLWYMNADLSAPLLTSASAIYTSGQDPNDVAPDTFSITWNYGTFVATLTNATPPSLEDGFAMPEMYGNWFYGQKGVLLVNRFGYELRPNNQRRGGAQQEPLKAEREIEARGMMEDPEGKGGSATVRHTRNFLDCVKSRAKTSCPIEVGFNSTLPTLLAILSVRRRLRVEGVEFRAVPALPVPVPICSATNHCMMKLGSCLPLKRVMKRSTFLPVSPLPEFQNVPPSCASTSTVIPTSARSARATSAMLW